MVHGEEASLIHFHEVGQMDAIVDIISVCSLVNHIKPDKIVISPINVGFGSVTTMHGLLPVPAPATIGILKNIIVYSNDIQGELCTPTGAALVKYFADYCGNLPKMIINKIGYGIGTKDFGVASFVRSYLGTAEA